MVQAERLGPDYRNPAGVVLGRSGAARPGGFHISDYGLAAIIYMDVLDPHVLISTVT